MEQKKRGRKQLGNGKRNYSVMLRFNSLEYEQLKTISESYNLDITERGVISPLLRRLVLDRDSEEKDRLPKTNDLSYQMNKIGNNINQLVKLAHHKSLRSPNSTLEVEIKKTNALLSILIQITIQELKG